MRVDQFDFELPEGLIALRPAEPRETAKLLVVSPDQEPELTDCRISDLSALLRRGDILVFNNTRVIPAQLEGQRSGRGVAPARIGINLHKRLSEHEWRAFARPARKLATGDNIVFGEGFGAIVTEKGEAGDIGLSFQCEAKRFEECLAEYGRMPLPPYIASRRQADSQDQQDYQTIFATQSGAVAAPTAGLHFTGELLSQLADKGVETALLTLHVGAGTFLPVKAEDTDDHRMHAEWGEIDAETAELLNRSRRNGGRIIAAGTTSLRLLETAANPDGEIQPFCGDTSIFITPGYRFKAVDLLFTNFHLPRSTLFMLISAFSGLETMKRAYAHAIADQYRFYSYGDACLLAPSAAATIRKQSL